MANNQIVVRGAREHNLKNLTVSIPRDQLVVITGLSGSGKSSLAFDTIYAEGRRRYVESLSAYARQFLGQMEKPDVDQIDGLSPAISIDQKGGSHNPRSTVGTVTEVYDYLRLLYARIGVPHCPNCGKVIARQTADQIVDAIMAMPDGTRILILAPLVRDRKGTHERTFEDIRKAGFVRVRVDGRMAEATDDHPLDRYGQHTIEAVVDRLIVRQGEDGLDRTRLADSVETALELGGGMLSVAELGADGEPTEERLYSQHFACPDCGFNLPEIEPRSFSFNSPHGACPDCQGLGTQQQIDASLIVPNPELSIRAGAILPWSKARNEQGYMMSLLAGVAEAYRFDVDTPWRNLSAEAKRLILEGTGGAKIDVYYATANGRRRHYRTQFEGVVRNLERRYEQTESDYIREELERYMSTRPCLTCGGGRLRPEIVAVTVGGQSIVAVSDLPVREALGWVRSMQGLPPDVWPADVRAAGDRLADGPSESAGKARRLTNGAKALAGGSTVAYVAGTSNDSATDSITNSSMDATLVVGPTAAGASMVLSPKAAEVSVGKPQLSDRERLIGNDILREIAARLKFLVDVGLDYLTLARRAGTLSGGEAQRIRLATQIGSQLMGVLYILDEPSIGLHQRDNARLIQTLLNLRNVGNTVIVVEHDEEMIRSADWILDLGPGAGEHGGWLVAEGTPAAIEAHPDSITGAFLSGRRRIPIPAERRKGNGHSLAVFGASENNLKHVDVAVPLATLTVVTGVSGSGKSTLVLDVLFNRVAQLLSGARARAGEHDRIEGYQHLDKVIDIDQSPIGRTPRSNPATYTGLFTPIRDLFAALPDAKLRGYKPGRFSFNVAGGRCEACAGDGILRIEMQFLPDIYVPCEVCHGARYNRETLQIKFKGKSISEVLNLTVDDALEFFAAVPAIRRKLETLEAVGLGYVRLGQQAPTLSGGEAQRVKLSKELSRQATGNTLYILDEPTTGLHFADVERLLQVLQALVDAGNTVLVIEHNLDIIKAADWVIDLGPEGGQRGGYVIATGTPEEVAADPKSFTGAFLAKILAGEWAPAPVALDPA